MVEYLSQKSLARIEKVSPSIVFTGARGSSAHAATYARHLLETRIGLLALPYSLSTASIYGRRLPFGRGSLFFAISQSGCSSDLIRSARLAHDAGASVIAVVNDENSPLSRLADIMIPQCAGIETSVAATKSYIATLTAISFFVAHLARDVELLGNLSTLPDDLLRASSLDWGRCTEVLIGSTNLFVIGRGPTLGIAQEAALKLKETSGIHAEAFSEAEVRHGPMELVIEGFPVLMFVPEDGAAAGFEDLAHTFLSRGATVLVVGAKIAGATELPVASTHSAALSAICLIQPFYCMAAELSRLRGHDPDHSRYLSKITDTR